MIKQKLVTIPGTTLVGTEQSRVGGQMPTASALPTEQALSYLTGGPASTSPLTNGSDSMSLPMFSVTTGNSDSGASFGTASGSNILPAGQGDGNADGKN